MAYDVGMNYQGGNRATDFAPIKRPSDMHSPEPSPLSPSSYAITPAIPVQSTARAIAKGATWQALGLLVTMLICFVLTGSIATGGAMALLSAGVGAIMFIIHERAWDRVSWGWRHGERTDAPE